MSEKKALTNYPKGESLMSEINQEIVLELYSAFAQGNLQHVAEMMARQFIASQTNALPWGGVYEGLAGCQTFIKKLRESIESRVTVEKTIEAGNHVVAIGRTAGQVRATDDPFDVRVVDVWTLKQGRVTRFEAYIDTPAMLRVLGGQQCLAEAALGFA